VLAGGAGATKLLAIGGLFGGAVTVGLAAALLQIGAPPVPPTVIASAPAIAARPGPRPGFERPVVAPSKAPLAVESNLGIGEKPSVAPEPVAQPAQTTPVVAPLHKHAKAINRDDSLAREAALVAEARSALSMGDPQSALRSIRVARSLPSKQLVPEELAVEEQALRALGRNDEANGINVMLRLQYPESALAP
jgi:hypothetical protein